MATMMATMKAFASFNVPCNQECNAKRMRDPEVSEPIIRIGCSLASQHSVHPIIFADTNFLLFSLQV